MHLLVFLPTLRPHGGVRYIIALCNELKLRGHTVVIQVLDESSETLDSIDPEINILRGTDINPSGFDLIISTTPLITHSLVSGMVRTPVLAYLQMAEELFNPTDGEYFETVMESYHTGIPIVTNAHWLVGRLRYFGVNGPVYHIPVGRPDWVWKREDVERKWVLLANWTSYNPCKDTLSIGAKTARHLRSRYGVQIASYGFPTGNYDFMPDVVIENANAAQLQHLYTHALGVLQATRLDVWSSVGMECLVTGAPLVRAVDLGDEFLVHNVNCLKAAYEQDHMIYLAEQAMESNWQIPNSEAGLLSWDEVGKQWEDLIVETIKRY